MQRISPVLIRRRAFRPALVGALLAIGLSATWTASALAEAGTDPPSATPVPSQHSHFTIRGTETAAHAARARLLTGHSMSITVKRLRGPIDDRASITVRVSGAGLKARSKRTRLRSTYKVTPKRAGLLRVRVVFADGGRPIQRSFRIHQSCRR